MKQFFTLAFLWLFATTIAQAQTPITISGNITTNTTWVSTNRYLLDGTVFVKNNATLTIEPGTVIFGKKTSTRPALVITRGAKIIADGAVNKPIVFTSDQPAGQRNPGDWGGIILLGKANINTPSGEFAIEGLPSSADATCGGTDNLDNSGILRYVRIEFPGIAFAQDKEINGLTMGAVGSGTTLDNVQVSYSGDDAYEWFGGTVNAKHLIAFKSVDDDFDTDYGFSGKIQYAVSLRDPNLADVSGSNAFESDNNAAGTYTTLRTSPIFANVTVVGPKATRNSLAATNFKRAAHIRKASTLNLFNSILMGFPDGILMDGARVTNATTNDTIKIQGVILACDTNLRTNVAAFNASNWFGTTTYSNTSIVSVNNRSDVMITDAFNATNPNFLPTMGSPALTGSVATNNPFFETTTYRGAFGTIDWTAEWTQFNPIVYTNVATNDMTNGITKAVIYPNPATNNASIDFISYKNKQVILQITNVLGSIVHQETVNIQAGKNTLNLPFAPKGVYLICIDNTTIGKLIME